ncbi:MAG: two-component regulator propeller domain-containing protein [Bacteroidia bacterium]|nr:two-component regulator propeller domain-containing protein [Bacteroidia bacterium]
MRVFILVVYWGIVAGRTLLCGQVLFLPAKHFSVEDGLPDAKIRCLLQDSRGFLWIGTENGLSCFDGRMFRNYFSGEGLDPISGNYITALAEDREGVLWIATLDGGLTRLDFRRAEGERTRVFYHHPGDVSTLPVNRLRSLIDFDEDYLLLSGELAPVVFLHKKTFQFSSWKGKFPLHPSHAAPSHVPGPGWIHFMKKIAPDRILVSFLNNHQTFLFDPGTGEQVSGLAQAPVYPGDQTYVCMALDETYAYAGGWQMGITRWKKDGDGTIGKIPLPDEVESLIALPDGRILAGGHSQGLFEYQPLTGKLSAIKLFQQGGKTLPLERVLAIFTDKEQKIWLGTNTGLFCFSPKSDHTTTGLLLPAENSKLIFGAGVSPDGQPVIFSSRGIYEQEKENGDFTLNSFTWNNQLLQITALTYTPSFGWLMGTESGLFFYDPKKKHIRPFPPLRHYDARFGTEPYPFNFLQIRDIYEDTIGGKPVIVTGALGYGAIVIDPHSAIIQMYYQPSGCDTCLQNSLVRKIIRDEEGGYWVATSRGLYHWLFDQTFGGGKFIPYHHFPNQKQGLSSDDILDIAFDETHTLWVATRNGLNQITEEGVHSYKFPVPRGNVLLSVLPVNVCEILVSSVAGMAIFDKTLGRFSAVVTDNAPWMAGRALDDHTVLIAGQNYWKVLNLEELNHIHEPPIPYLAEFSVNGHPQSLLQPLSIGYRDYFSARISALQLHDGANFDLQYRLGGDEQIWQTLSREGEILISRLRPGDHQLEVRVAAKNGETFQEKVLLELTVRPPFWFSLPFIVSMVLLLSGSMFAFYRYRLYQHQKQQAIRMDIASDLHDEVGSALGSIAMGSELAGKFLDDHPEKSRLVLENIRSITGKTLQNMGDIIWAINPKYDQGEKITARMRQVGNDLLVSGGISVEYLFDPEMEQLRLSMPVRKNFMLIYKEVLHNILKHAAATEVKIKLHLLHKQLVLEIRDNGKGFIPGAYPGNGLGNMQRRADMIGAKFQLTTAPGAGVEISLRAAIARIRE